MPTSTRSLLDSAATMDMEIEGLHTETGPGVLEAALRVDDALAAADKAALFKTFTKILAQRRGWMATFMAKWSRDWPGQSGHLHASLQSIKTGKGVFHDAVEAACACPTTMRWFVGGQQALMPELLAMVACTVNTYTRLIPGFWAPTDASLGRREPHHGAARHSGLARSRSASSTGSPRPTSTPISRSPPRSAPACGASRTASSPTRPSRATPTTVKFPKQRQLPRSLMEAAERLKASQGGARALFGDAFVDHYAATREWEEREFRKAITDWELERYFEII